MKKKKKKKKKKKIVKHALFLKKKPFFSMYENLWNTVNGSFTTHARRFIHPCKYKKKSFF
jgi:hypothetical protein